ncbi:cornifelin -like protein [Brachionus plicatilis]|uniref:Cornifelin-like protein n=1 Tax=Brachionus plicatilis TaxID=10195 RepID=A0A3M7SQ95_BRAPC|nr:cornifelin -like protein [Brachionus plicatilis]
MKNHSGQIVVTDSENVWNYENQWAQGLCDCCSNTKICCIAYFCLPCFTCSIFKRTDEFFCTPFFLPASIISLRSKLRTAFRIKGSICGDSLTTIFCPMCTAIQLYNELESQGL